jgi:hypothetical protein
MRTTRPWGCAASGSGLRRPQVLRDPAAGRPAACDRPGTVARSWLPMVSLGVGELRQPYGPGAGPERRRDIGRVALRRLLGVMIETPGRGDDQPTCCAADSRLPLRSAPTTSPSTPWPWTGGTPTWPAQHRRPASWPSCSLIAQTAAGRRRDLRSGPACAADLASGRIWPRSRSCSGLGVTELSAASGHGRGDQGGRAPPDARRVPGPGRVRAGRRERRGRAPSRRRGPGSKPNPP